MRLHIMPMLLLGVFAAPSPVQQAMAQQSAKRYDWSEMAPQEVGRGLHALARRVDELRHSPESTVAQILAAYAEFRDNASDARAVYERRRQEPIVTAAVKEHIDSLTDKVSKWAKEDGIDLSLLRANSTGQSDIPSPEEQAGRASEELEVASQMMQGAFEELRQTILAYQDHKSMTPLGNSKPLRVMERYLEQSTRLTKDIRDREEVFFAARRRFEAVSGDAAVKFRGSATFFRAKAAETQFASVKRRFEMMASLYEGRARAAEKRQQFEPNRETLRELLGEMISSEEVILGWIRKDSGHDVHGTPEEFLSTFSDSDEWFALAEALDAWANVVEESLEER